MTFAALQFTEMMFYGIRSLHNYHNFKNFKLYFGIFKKSVFFRKKNIFFRKNADVFFENSKITFGKFRKIILENFEKKLQNFK